MTPHGTGGSGPDVSWDAGDLGCGELLLELKLKLKTLVPGATLRLVARDPGAVVDLPAWCGLTGHHLERAEPPTYVIRKKED